MIHHCTGIKRQDHLSQLNSNLHGKDAVEGCRFHNALNIIEQKDAELKSIMIHMEGMRSLVSIVAIITRSLLIGEC